MVKLNKYYKVDYKSKKYAVCKLPYLSKTTPIILDWDIFNEIKKLDKNWHVNEKGMVVTYHKYFDNFENINKTKEISIHDVVLKIHNGFVESDSILHINRLGIDNRIDNLMYDTNNKQITKNIKKKSRTIVFPKDSGINVDEIPSYIWYLKEDLSHGERFVINVGDITWKSTASKKVSLKYKLEETKKYMRYLKDKRSDLFEDFSMNGDLNDEGKKLLDDFFEITKKAGYKLNNSIDLSNTDKLLEINIDGMSNDEIMLLELFNPEGERHNFNY